MIMESDNLQENDINEPNNITFAETRQIVDAYLKRSLSQNAKSPSKDFKPEGDSSLSSEDLITKLHLNKQVIIN